MNFLKPLLISAAIIFLVDPISAEECDISIRGSVSREVFNYEEGEEDLAVKAGLSFSSGETFSFNYTELRDLTLDRSSRTWNVEVKDLAGFMNFTAGYFNLHFGSGLMMGKASYTSPDPFSEKILLSRENAISPSNSGNPAYSLSGAAVTLKAESDDITLYLLPFFSLQRRYITADSYDRGVIDSSLFTLNSRTEKSGAYTEPVNIINCGGAAGIRAYNLFNLQIYTFRTDLKSDSGRDILWDRDKYRQGEGTNSILNTGIFAEYSDSSISIFIEPAVSSINGDPSQTGRAVACGISLRNRLIDLSLRGKNSDNKFHSEYSSGGRVPERVWESRCAVSPLYFLKTGLLVYGRKNLSPSYNRDYTEGSILEEIFTEIKFGGIASGISLRRKRHSTSGDDTVIDQGSLHTEYSMTDRIYLRARTTIQDGDGGDSYAAAFDLKIMFLVYFSISAGYTGVFVHGELPYYAMITPATEQSMITRFSETSHCASAIFRYRNVKDSFHLRFTSLKTGSGFRGEAESALSLFF